MEEIDRIDNEFGYRVLNVQYLWIWHKDSSKCRRLYLLPIFDMYQKYYLFYKNSELKSFKDVKGPLNFVDKSKFSKKCGASFDLFTSVIYEYDYLDFVKQHKKKHPNENYVYVLRKLSNDYKLIKFNPKPPTENNFISPLKIEGDAKPKINLVLKDIPSNEPYELIRGILFYYSTEKFFENEANQKLFRNGKNSFSRYSMQGRRPNMEDTELICDMGNGNFMFAILDGHGDNGRASYHFSRDIPIRINDLLKEDKHKSMEEIIKEAFLLSDETFFNLNRMKGGTCFTGVLLTPEDIYVINLGDSRTSVYDAESTSKIFTSTDHKPSYPQEKKRLTDIIKNINYLNDEGKAVLQYLNQTRILGSLAVSRALGDNDLKGEQYKELAFGRMDLEYVWQGTKELVSPEPVVTKIKRGNGNMDVIIHCDGINEPLELKAEDDVLRMYADKAEKQKNSDYTLISKEICNYAYSKGSGDNLSMITFSL